MFTLSAVGGTVPSVLLYHIIDTYSQEEMCLDIEGILRGITTDDRYLFCK